MGRGGISVLLQPQVMRWTLSPQFTPASWRKTEHILTTITAQSAAPSSDRSTSRPLIRLTNVSKIFSNGTTALQDMSLDVQQGEFISLLGPSGCGKSTALRIIAGLGGPSSGSIEWPTSGHDAMGKALPEISFVFQEPTLMPWATVFNNVWLPLRLKGVSKAAARDDVLGALEMVGLDKFADAYPRELSGGMKMRVSLPVRSSLVRNCCSWMSPSPPG